MACQVNDSIVTSVAQWKSDWKYAPPARRKTMVKAKHKIESKQNTFDS
jgi:hypothetical protein